MRPKTITLRSLPIILVLLTAVLAACAPATSTPAPAVATEQPAVPPVETVQPAEPTPLAVVTSRGDELFTTDPSTVQLAAGQLQLVEFFRFT